MTGQHYKWWFLDAFHCIISQYLRGFSPLANTCDFNMFNADRGGEKKSIINKYTCTSTPKRICVISLTKLSSWQENYPGSQSSILFYYCDICTCLAFLKKCTYLMWVILKWIYGERKRGKGREGIFFSCQLKRSVGKIEELRYWCERNSVKRPNGAERRRRTFNVSLHLSRMFALHLSFQHFSEQLILPRPRHILLNATRRPRLSEYTCGGDLNGVSPSFMNSSSGADAMTLTVWKPFAARVK